MKIETYYSHLNGMEHLQVHYPDLWKTIVDAVGSISADDIRTKISDEKPMKGRILISPKDLNTALDKQLKDRGWTQPDRVEFIYSADAATNRKLLAMPFEEQKRMVQEGKADYIKGHTKADFRYKRVALEVQFGKYSFVQYDIFAKHAANYMNDLVDVGIELVPMHSMYKNMSSGPSYYERNLNEILRQGRIFPPVPLVLAGIAE